MAFSINTIKASANDISLASAPATTKNKFCDVWPGAKQALTLLQSIVKNPIAKGAIGIVIAAGDAVAARIC